MNINERLFIPCVIIPIASGDTEPKFDPAVCVRAAWMSLQGLPFKEICEEIANDPPSDLKDEVSQLEAMVRIGEMNKTPIELQRYGPPHFQRPTIDDLENAIVESIERMSNEDIEAELREAGIDMAPSIAKLHAMIEAKKAEIDKQQAADG